MQIAARFGVIPANVCPTSPVDCACAMSDSTIHPDAAERKRFWIWLVAALLALLLLFWVVKWTNRQAAPLVSLCRFDAGPALLERVGPAGGQEGEWL